MVISNIYIFCTGESPLSDLVDEMGVYMKGIEGGIKRPESVAQKIQQMKYLLNISKVSTKEDLLSSTIFWPAIEDKINSNKWKADTARIYLQTLREFYEFILEKECFNLNSDEKTKITVIISKIPKLKKSLLRLSKSQNMEYRESQMEKIADRERINEFLKSSYYTSIVELMKKIDQGEIKHITMSMYVCSLRMILTIISLRTPKRSGILGQIEIGDYWKKTEVDGEYTLSISNHKTAKTYGKSILPLNKVQCKWIDIYINKIRSTLLQLPSPLLFLKHNGTSLTSVDVGVAIRETWKNAGLGHVTVNLFRQEQQDVRVTRKAVFHNSWTTR